MLEEARGLSDLRGEKKGGGGQAKEVEVEELRVSIWHYLWLLVPKGPLFVGAICSLALTAATFGIPYAQGARSPVHPCHPLCLAPSALPPSLPNLHSTSPCHPHLPLATAYRLSPTRPASSGRLFDVAVDAHRNQTMLHEAWMGQVSRLEGGRMSRWARVQLVRVQWTLAWAFLPDVTEAKCAIRPDSPTLPFNSFPYNSSLTTWPPNSLLAWKEVIAALGK